MPMKVHLVVIDPQNDFMGNDDGSPYTVDMGSITQTASLPVPHGVSDMKRLSGVVDRLIDKISGIQVTLDSHRVIDVSHGGMWRDAQGNPPPPFTIITRSEISDGIWSPRNPRLRQRMLDYTAALAASKGQYDLMIWPEHCLIGSWGHNVQADLAQALQRWERKRFANVDFVTKGDNIYTEHYGALMAEVPDPTDPTTQLNTGFLTTLKDADIIGLAGEASSHCVKATIQQIADNLGDEHLKKFRILTDCTSPVLHPLVDFPTIAKNFLNEMAGRGMVLTTAAEFLA